MILYILPDRNLYGIVRRPLSFFQISRFDHHIVRGCRLRGDSQHLALAKFLDNPCGHVCVFLIDRNYVACKAYDGSVPDFSFCFRFLDGLENRKILRCVFGSSTFLDFNREHASVAVYNEVDCFFIGISVEIKRRSESCVQETLVDFHDDPCLEEFSAHGAVF